MADKHPKRPRDFSQAAKLAVDIASGRSRTVNSDNLARAPRVLNRGPDW